MTKIYITNKSTEDNRRIRMVPSNTDSESYLNEPVVGAMSYGEQDDINLCLSPMPVVAGNARQTPCVEITGNFDLLVDQTLIGIDIDQQEILDALSTGKYGVTASECIIRCTSTGELNLAMKPTSSIIVPESQLMYIAVEQTGSGPVPIDPSEGVSFWAIQILPPTEGDVWGTLWITYPDGRTDTVGQNFDMAGRNIIDYWDILIKQIFGSGSRSESEWQTEFNPLGYQSNQMYNGEFCRNDVARFSMAIAVQNTAAITNLDYYYKNWSGSQMAALRPVTNNVFRMKVGKWDDTAGSVIWTELTSYPYTQTTDAASVELAMLNHFKTELEAYAPDIQCEIIEEPLKCIPNAYSFDLSPDVNSMHMRIYSNEQYYFVVPKQTNGTAQNPQQRNPTYGFDVNDTGLLHGNPDNRWTLDFSGDKPSDFLECVQGQAGASDVGLTAVIRGRSEPEVPDEWWRPTGVTLRIIPTTELIEREVPNVPDGINILDIFEGDNTITLTSCGYFENAPA